MSRLSADSLAVLAQVLSRTHERGDVWFMPCALVPLFDSDVPEHPAVVLRVRRDARGDPLSLVMLPGTSKPVPERHRLLVPRGEAGLRADTSFHLRARARSVDLESISGLRSGAYLGRLPAASIEQLEAAIASDRRLAWLRGLPA